MRTNIFIILNSLSLVIALISLGIFIADRLESSGSGFIFQTYRPYIAIGLIALHVVMHLIERDRFAWLTTRQNLSFTAKNLCRYILIAIFCAITAFCTLTWGPSLPITLLIACFTATVTGLLLNGRKAIIVIAIVAAILLLGVNNESNIARLETWRNTPISYTDIILYAGIIGAIAIISWFANRQIWLMLRRAQRSEHELELERNDLEIKVADRTKEIKDLQMRQMEYLASQAQMGAMAKGVFHDLMSPLTSVALYVDEISKTSNKIPNTISPLPAADLNKINNNLPEQANMYIQKAINSAKKMRDLLDSISKHISDIRDIDAFNPCDEISDAILLMSYKARCKHVILTHTSECCSDGNKNSENKNAADIDVKMLGNSLNFHRIILNLVSNAIDACQNTKNAKVSVDLRLSRANKTIVVKVSDNGCGIKPEDIGKIFELNWYDKDKNNGKGSKKDNDYPNHGIGLSIVKHIVIKDFGGRIGVESLTSGENRGTTFTMTFPV